LYVVLLHHISLHINVKRSNVAHPMNDNTSRCDGSHEHDWRTCADFAEFIFAASAVRG
jgi:hypothetical protein